MSDPNVPPTEPETEDDPIKPYKALIGTAITLLSYLLTSNVLNNPWDIVATAIIAGLSVFYTPNPKRLKAAKN